MWFSPSSTFTMVVLATNMVRHTTRGTLSGWEAFPAWVFLLAGFNEASISRQPKARFRMQGRREEGGGRHGSWSNVKKKRKWQPVPYDGSQRSKRTNLRINPTLKEGREGRREGGTFRVGTEEGGRHGSRSNVKKKMEWQPVL